MRIIILSMAKCEYAIGMTPEVVIFNLPDNYIRCGTL